MDDADLTAEREERHAELMRRYAKPVEVIPPTGFCMNCDEPLDDTHRFCFAACGDDWLRRVRGRKLKGNVEI